jgi:antitoxin component YwqK of YwqJK toxin-antitoxin module
MEPFPSDIIKLMVEFQPLLYGVVCCLSRYWKGVYGDQSGDFKRRLATPVTGLRHSRYNVLPDRETIHGLWEKLDDNLNVVVTSTYNTGKHHGVKRKFSSDGTMHKMYIYIYGKKQIEFAFNIYERMYSATPFYDGKKHGKVLHYFNNHMLDSITEYQYGVKWGLHIEYRYDDVIVCNYVNNVLHGEYYKYTYDGVVLRHGHYVNERKDGVWIERHKNNQLKSKIEYLSGKIVDFEVVEYNSNGGLHSVSYYLNGTEIREYFRRYHDNGMLMSIGYNVVQGLTANYRVFDENGILTTNMVIRNRKLVLVHYHKNGEISDKQTLIYNYSASARPLA